MKFNLVLLGFTTAGVVYAQQDTFNYRGTSGRDYGLEDWDEVSCNNLATCPGWPAKLIGSQGWRPSRNECRWCPATGNSCGQHRQSPIDLFRDRAIPGSPNEKECPDWHWIQYLDGTCSWDDMEDQFEIGRHALMIHTPLESNGDIACVNEAGERKFPKLDYSKGFPDWWYLSRTDITVPSEHTQHGQRYAAEIKLSHFYEIDHYKNKLGVISIFMQDFEGEPSWPYLDKLICKWRAEEEKKRRECGLPPAPVYKMCELYRGQVRTEDDLEAPTAAVVVPTAAPLVAPPAIPVVNFGGDPEEFRLPLALCQGDCDFSSDCAPGLICFRRDAFGPVPGCIGGDVDDTNTDYCIFDPYGPGYTVPTESPTVAPSVTARPTLVPLPEQALEDFGGTPPADKFPLQLCQGDCDKDADCALGLMCFQRTSNETVPGCIGGETDIQKTDYCVLDPYGPGYEVPVITNAPVVNPTNPPVPSPTEGPSARPSSAPTNLPTEKPLVPTSSPTFFPRRVGDPLPVQNIGWEPPIPLAECAGDCDIDDDCGPGMYCYQRNVAFENVPGCLGGDEDPTLTDYCTYNPLPIDVALDSASPTKAPASSSPTSKTTDSPTKAPTEAIDRAPDSQILPNVTIGPTDKPTLPPVLEATLSPSKTATQSPVNAATEAPVDNFPPLKDLGWTPPPQMKPLGRCEGDCDIRQDCGPGLDCYQRYLPNIAVPGCSGGESDPTLTDYCIPIEYMNGVVTTTPQPVSATNTPQQPTPAPVVVTNAPIQPPAETRTDTFSPVTAVQPSDPPAIECDAYPDVNFFRMCKSNGCCTDPRSNTEFCHESYRLLGDAVESACHHCCLEEQGESKSVGEANEDHPTKSQLLQCDAVDQPDRMCRSGSSCCDDSGSGSSFCEEQFGLYSLEEMESICWYCCHPSKPFTAAYPGSRMLDESFTFGTKHADSKIESNKNVERTLLGDHDKSTHDVNGRPIIVREENFEPKGMMDEDAYFEELMSSFRRRALQESRSENYDDVIWWPYEWLLKVGTEYYFRYEGTQTVPPCYDTAHWRVFKDPIRVAPHQMRELERLIAWRRGDDCNVDTAGKPTGDENRVDVARPLQSYHRLHRKVFCECQDWPSKFTADRQWCRNWQNKPPEQRLIENPYNFPSAGFEFVQ